MLTEGYCHLHRKILKHFTKPYSEINAWIWMITQAEWRNGDTYGKVITTTRQLGSQWGVSKMTVSRWLKKWIDDGRISCHFAEFPRRTGASSPHVTVSVTVGVTDPTEITLINYEQYQTPPKKGVTKGVTVSGTLLNTEKNLKEEKGLPKKLQIELLKPGLKSDAEEYPNLNIPREFKKWQNWMESKGKYPKKYSASWSNWLIKAEEIRLEKTPKSKGLSSEKRKEFGLD